MVVKLVISVVCIGAGVRWIAAAWRGKDAKGYDVDRKSGVVETVLGIGAILVGLAILGIPTD
jgi:hypothetical protein